MTSTRMATRRGAQSNVRAGVQFEEMVLAAIGTDPRVCLMRGNPGTKVLPDGRGGSRVIYTRKNGVDLVGIAYGRAIALECKRMPNATRLSGVKDDSTAAEARFLHEFHVATGPGAFLVLDDERQRIYVVPASKATDVLAHGVPLRDRAGNPCTATVEIPASPAGMTLAIRTAVDLVLHRAADAWVGTVVPAAAV